MCIRESLYVIVEMLMKVWVLRLCWILLCVEVYLLPPTKIVMQQWSCVWDCVRHWLLLCVLPTAVVAKIINTTLVVCPWSKYWLLLCVDVLLELCVSLCEFTWFCRRIGKYYVKFPRIAVPSISDIRSCINSHLYLATYLQERCKRKCACIT